MPVWSLKYALRFYARHKGHTAINIIGLAIGLACFQLIALFVMDEVSYDRFHEHSERIYRIAVVDQTREATERKATIDGPWARTLVEELPEIVEAVRLRLHSHTIVRYEDKVFYEDRIFQTDPAIFRVFTLPKIAGSPSEGLKRPNSVVLTFSMAQKYFGGTDGATGKTIQLDDEDYTVVGVIHDLPNNAHFQFDFLIPIPETIFGVVKLNEWSSNRAKIFYTYILTIENAPTEHIVDGIARIAPTYIGEEDASRSEYFLEALHDIHLKSDLGSLDQQRTGVKYVYALMLIGLLILATAAFNYINLATARSSQRAREVGVRLTFGASSRQLWKQFMLEPILLFVVVLVVAFVVTASMLPYFNSVSGKQLTFEALIGWRFLIAILGAGIVLAVGASWYPVFHLIRRHPIDALHGGYVSKPSKDRFRRGLVVLQIAISTGLVMCTVVVLQQLNHLRDHTLRFEEDQVVIVPLGRGGAAALYPEFRNRVQEFPEILSVSGASGALTWDMLSLGLRPEGADADVMTTMLFVDYDFTQTLRLEIIAGRDLQKELGSDLTTAHLINEAAVRAYGWLDPLGKKIPLIVTGFEGGKENARVVGIVKDFQLGSPMDEVDPLLITLVPKASRYAFIRIRAGNIASVLNKIQNVYDELGSARPFEYSFLDEEIEALYRSEQRMALLFTFFSVVAIALACLGLVGLANFSVQQRTKEVGIRKVFGASSLTILLLFARRYLLLFFFAILIALPVAFVALSGWLQNFPQRIEISVGTVIITTLFILGASLVSVCFQTVRAAIRNPVDVMRRE